MKNVSSERETQDRIRDKGTAAEREIKKGRSYMPVTMGALIARPSREEKRGKKWGKSEREELESGRKQ